MANHVLFICKSCNSVHSKDTNYEQSDGAALLNQLLSLYHAWSRRDELTIQPVGCLWTCSQPCAVAFSAEDKSTYLFTKVPSSEATALLRFGELYLDSSNGAIAWKQFPKALQSAAIAKIPAVSLPGEPDADA